jgi:hypothetical protein
MENLEEKKRNFMDEPRKLTAMEGGNKKKLCDFGSRKV